MGAVSVWSRRSFIAFGLPLSSAVYVVCGGIISLLGWVLGIPRLIDWYGDGIVIKANAAICVTAAGAGLLLLVLLPRQKHVIRLFGLITAVIAGLTLLQHITGLNFGIDTLLFTEPPGVLATASPGRMGPPASSSLTAIGLGLIFSTNNTRLRKWASILGIAALAISAFSLGGYLFGANQLYAIPRLTGIALQTATMIAALGVGIVVEIPEHGLAAALGRDDAGGAVFRRLFLPIVFVSLVLGWLRVTGQEAGLFDTAFGTAARTLIEISLLLGVLWWTANDISGAEKRAQEASRALAERDERMRGVLEALSDSFVSLDANFRFTYANAAILAMLAENGREEANIIGKNIFAVFPGARETELGQALIRSMQDRTPADLEEYFVPFGRWFHARYFPTEDGGLSVFALDISERKKAEELVRRRAHELMVLYGFADRLNRATSQAEVYGAALDAIKQALGCDRASILLFDEVGVMRFVASRGLSSAYQDAVTGHSPWKKGETGARPIGIDDIASADIDDDLKSVIIGEGIHALGFIPLISNEILIGKFMVYFDEPHAFSKDEFEIAMTVGYQIALGVERKRTEQETAKLAAIVASSGDAIIGKDLNGVINSWNRGAEQIFGYTSEEAIGMPVTMLIPPNRAEEELEILERIRRGESLNHYETIRRRKDGTLLDMSLTVSPLADAQGRIFGASKIARDITERKRGEAAIRDREIMSRLVEAQEAERHRIARDLHDHLGQQLTALRLKLESVKTMSAGHSTLVTEIDELQKYASRIDLDINYLAWELRPTELDHLGLRDALGSFVREWSKTYDISAEFHSTWTSDGRLHAELETNLYRIVQEALNNILKHAGAKRVSVLLENRKDGIVLIIEDDGNGFNFEANQRNGKKGKGLGLIGMRERTALLGGTLDIESRPGNGTTVFARVPLRPAEHNGDNLSEPPA